MQEVLEVKVTRTLAFVAVFTLVLLAFGCAAPQPAQPAPLVGAWRSSVQFKSGMLASIKDLEFMYVFNAGGTLTESSNYDAAPPVPPAYGVWREVAPNRFEAKYEFFSTAQAAAEAFKSGAGWLPLGRGVLTERITLSAEAQTFTSTIRFEAFDLRGGPVAGGGEAQGRAQRIQF